MFSLQQQHSKQQQELMNALFQKRPCQKWNRSSSEKRTTSRPRPRKVTGLTSLRLILLIPKRRRLSQSNQPVNPVPRLKYFQVSKHLLLQFIIINSDCCQCSDFLLILGAMNMKVLQFAFKIQQKPIYFLD